MGYPQNSENNYDHLRLSLLQWYPQFFLPVWAIKIRGWHYTCIFHCEITSFSHCSKKQRFQSSPFGRATSPLPNWSSYWQRNPSNPQKSRWCPKHGFRKKRQKKVPLANTPIMYIYIYIGCSWGPQRIAKLVELLFSQTNKHNLGATLCNQWKDWKIWDWLWFTSDNNFYAWFTTILPNGQKLVGLGWAL